MFTASRGSSCTLSRIGGTRVRDASQFFGYNSRQYSRAAVKEGDIVLLKHKNDDTKAPILTSPLRITGKISVLKGRIPHTSLIGKCIRDVVSVRKGLEYRIHQASLADYVRLSPRIVTPVYPADANLIVSLLDLHPEAAIEDGENNDNLQIFEAGTGHGALTLYLARAIHGANPPAAPLPPVKDDAVPSNESVTITEDASDVDNSNPSTDDVSSEIEMKACIETYNAWLPSRRAVIHTLDISPVHSKHAEDVVRNFRHGMYYSDIDFHVGTIPDYLTKRLEETPEPFLSHAILDLPSCHSYMEVIGRALKPDGLLLVFCPSITQINTCVKVVKDEKLPFLLENTLELGAGIGVGGKEWDVRAVKPRAVLKAEAEMRNFLDGEVESETDVARTENEITPSQDSGWEMVCRPKVGNRIVGGGFLGVFRRMEQY